MPTILLHLLFDMPSKKTLFVLSKKIPDDTRQYIFLYLERPGFSVNFAFRPTPSAEAKFLVLDWRIDSNIGIVVQARQPM
jgi:hypothetical protein